MTGIRIVPIERLDLAFAPQPWSFATERGGEIERHFADLKNRKPSLWNGRVLLLHDFLLDGGTLGGRYFETDFASFIAWRDWDFPDRTVRNCFALAALRGSDGGFLLGVMAQHTANAGKIYFVGGTPDPDDIVGDRVDLNRSVLRELAEETGLSAVDVEAEPGWHAAIAGPRVALMKVLRAAVPAATLRERVLGHLEGEAQPELADIRIVRSPAELDPMMPNFITEFLTHAWR